MTGERTRLACYLRGVANFFLQIKCATAVDEDVGRNTRRHVFCLEGNSRNESGTEKSLPAFA